MRKWLGFILLLGLLMFPATAGAQNTINLESVTVELWSEFDQPSMLVINEFVLAQDVPLPATVAMRFPKEGNLVAVAVNQSGDLFNADFEGAEEQGDWQTIKINVQTYDPYRIEYYQPLTRDGKKREFEYRWFGEYAVKELRVNILIPSDSTDVITSPILSSTGNSSDGAYILGSATKSGLQAGQSYDFRLEYARESDLVTNSGDSVQPSAPIDSDTPGRIAIDRLPYVIGGVGVVLIVIALFFYWRSTQSSVATPRRRKRQAGGESTERQAYCHECGARAQEGDRFCRTCGSRLRTGE